MSNARPPRNRPETPARLGWYPPAVTSPPAAPPAPPPLSEGEPKLPEVESIARIRLEPGDVLVLSCPKDVWLDEPLWERLRQALEEHFPGHRAFVLEGGMKLDVVAPDKVEQA